MEALQRPRNNTFKECRKNGTSGDRGETGFVATTKVKDAPIAPGEVAMDRRLEVGTNVTRGSKEHLSSTWMG